jgi:hypothetical protein
MVSLAITAANSATPSIQAALGQTRLAQAQREADQAEANAKDLRARADEAQQQAQDSQDNVQKVADRNRQDETTYSAIARSSTAEVPLKVQNLIEQMYNATSEQRAQSGNPLKTRANPAPVVNTQGQATGRIVDVSA